MVTALHAWSQCHGSGHSLVVTKPDRATFTWKDWKPFFVIPVEGRGYSITCLVTVLWVWSHSGSDYKPDRAVDYLKELEVLLVIPVEGRGHSITCLVTVSWVWSQSGSE